MERGEFAVGDMLRFGWDAFKGNPWLFIMLALVSGVVSSGLRYQIAGVGAVASLVQGLVGVLLNAFVLLGVTSVTLKYIDGQRGTLADFINVYPLFLRYLGAYILFGILVAMGLILLVVPGVILAIRLQFFGYYLVDRKLGVAGALRESWSVTQGMMGKLFFFDLTLLGIIVVGFISFTIGLLVAVPLVWLAFAYVYRSLQPLEGTAELTSAGTC